MVSSVFAPEKRGIHAGRFLQINRTAARPASRGNGRYRPGTAGAKFRARLCDSNANRMWLSRKSPSRRHRARRGRKARGVRRRRWSRRRNRAPRRSTSIVSAAQAGSACAVDNALRGRVDGIHVARNHHGNRVPEPRQRGRKRAHHIRQSAALRPGTGFRRNHHDARQAWAHGSYQW